MARKHGSMRGRPGGRRGIARGIGPGASSLRRVATIGMRITEILVPVNRTWNSPRRMIGRRLPGMATTILLMAKVTVAVAKVPRAIFAASISLRGSTVTQKKPNQILSHGKEVMLI